MSFYMTLNGRKSNLITELDPPINLNNEYEVAITDISFNCKPLINYGTIKLQSKRFIDISNKVDKLEAQIILEDNISLEYFVEQINHILSYEIYYNYFKLYNETISITKGEFMSDDKIFTDFNDKLIYLFNKQIYPIEYEGYEIIEINGYIEKFFILNQLNISKTFDDYKIEQDAYFQNKSLVRTPISVIMPKKINVLSNIFIHSNFTDHVYYGNIKTGILRVLPVKYKNNNMAITFKKYVYVTVKNTVLNTINIKFLDENQNYINCDNIFTEILINLHFKPKKYNNK